MLNPEGNVQGVGDAIGVKLLMISWVFVGSVIKTGKGVAVDDRKIGGAAETSSLALHPASIKQRVRNRDRKKQDLIFIPSQTKPSG
jgi:hypothetical protein